MLKFYIKKKNEMNPKFQEKKHHYTMHSNNVQVSHPCMIGVFIYLFIVICIYVFLKYFILNIHLYLKRGNNLCSQSGYHP
jgi:hypothetical protein